MAEAEWLLRQRLCPQWSINSQNSNRSLSISDSDHLKILVMDEVGLEKTSWIYWSWWTSWCHVYVIAHFSPPFSISLEHSVFESEWLTVFCHRLTYIISLLLFFLVYLLYSFLCLSSHDWCLHFSSFLLPPLYLRLLSHGDSGKLLQRKHSLEHQAISYEADKVHNAPPMTLWQEKVIWAEQHKSIWSSIDLYYVTAVFIDCNKYLLNINYLIQSRNVAYLVENTLFKTGQLVEFFIAFISIGTCVEVWIGRSWAWSINLLHISQCFQFPAYWCPACSQLCFQCSNWSHGSIIPSMGPAAHTVLNGNLFSINVHVIDFYFEKNCLFFFFIWKCSDLQI